MNPRSSGLGSGLRIAFWLAVLLAPLALVLADRASRWEPRPRAGLRLVTVNVDTRPLEVAEALRPLAPDVVFMQEAAVSCAAAARALGLQSQDGSDQCLLSRWPITSVKLA
jgi:hypothetical protein